MRYHVNIFYRVVDSFFRHRWLFLIAVLTTTSAAVIGLRLRSKTYKGSALIRIVPNDTTVVLGSLDSSKALVGVSVSEQYVERLNALIRDNRPGGFLDTALREAKLRRPINIDPRTKDPRYAALSKNLLVGEDSNMTFSINLTWNDRGECERILSALQAQYIEAIGRGQQAQAVATVRFLDTQIKGYARRMRVAEKALIEHKQRNSGQSPEAQTADFTELTSLKVKLDDLRITSEDSHLKRRAIEQRIAQISPMNIKEQTVEDSPTTLQMRELQARRNALLADGWLATSFRVKAIDEQIGKLNEQIKREDDPRLSGRGSISETKFQNNPEYAALTQQLTDAKIAEITQKAQVRQLEQRIREYEGRIAQMPAAERELADKMRNYTVLKTEYENLLQRREEAQLKANLDRVSARSKLSPVGVISAEPTVDNKKSALLLVMSLFLSLLVGASLVVLSEWMDHSLRYEADAEKLLGLPVLASVVDSKDLYLPQRTARRAGPPAWHTASANGQRASLNPPCRPHGQLPGE